MEEEITEPNKVYDAIIIGAGICGIIFLKYAKEKGLDCLVLEKQSDVGGLWNRIPSWQDIQNSKVDFAINDIPLKGEKQPEVKQYVKEWVDQNALSPFIKLNCEVTNTFWEKEKWKVQTKEGAFWGRYLIAATGVQNEPWIPEVERSNSGIVEMHSFSLQNPEALTDKKVTIVGGNASAWDLLDLAIEYGAKEIHWVYRTTRWFLPSTKSKQANKLNDLRILARAQTIKRSPEGVTSFLQGILKKKYAYFKLNEIQPAEPLDLTKHQLNPGRPLMIKHLDTISRHQNEVNHIDGREITLKNGESFKSDVLLWATGYRMNLEYLGLPEYNQIKTLKDLFPRLGSLIRSLDYPNLFFPGMTLIESTSSTPFFAAVEAKSMVAHILGKCEIPNKNLSNHIVHWDLFKYFARFDHYNYPKFWWKIKYFLLAWWYSAFPRKLVKI